MFKILKIQEQKKIEKLEDAESSNEEEPDK